MTTLISQIHPLALSVESRALLHGLDQGQLPVQGRERDFIIDLGDAQLRQGGASGPPDTKTLEAFGIPMRQHVQRGELCGLEAGDCQRVRLPLLATVSCRMALETRPVRAGRTSSAERLHAMADRRTTPCGTCGGEEIADSSVWIIRVKSRISKKPGIDGFCHLQ
jgi:hypothetical protein